MANGSGFVQRAPLPPLNSPTITEADRARVYGAIGKELNNILNGVGAYHADSVKKSSKDLRSELNDFIGAVESLKDAVNDPGNVVGDALRHLKAFEGAFTAGVSNDVETMWNDSKDKRDSGIRLPDSLTPTTEDHNIISVDPDSDGQFSAPNPLSPNQWPKELKASTGSSDDVAASGETPDVYRRLTRRVGSSGAGSIVPMNAKKPAPVPQVASKPLGIFTGEPMPGGPLPPPIWGLPDNSDSSGNWFTRLAGATQEPLGPMLGPPGGTAVPFASSSNPDTMGGLAGRIAALAGIDPENPDQPVPPPGGLLGLFLSGRR